MKKISDGWHTVQGYDVHVKDGCITHGTTGTGYDYRTTYPYRASRYGGWDKDTGLTVAAFRACYARGTVRMM